MNKKFEYTYSAPTEQERKEIEHIQSQYRPQVKSTSKLDILRKLDNKVKNVPTITSLILGIVGILTFGLGLTLILEWKIYIGGVVLGFVGCVVMGIAPLLHNKIYNQLKNKYSSEILKLSGELLNEQTKEL